MLTLHIPATTSPSAPWVPVSYDPQYLAKQVSLVPHADTERALHGPKADPQP